MINTGHLYMKDNSRLFVNVSLGCKSKCSYCYLSKLGYKNKSDLKFLTAKEIIKQIEDLKIDLNSDVLISFGCFSECLDEDSFTETKKMLKYFLENGNQVQISTKKEFKKSDVKELEKYVKYVGQLIIFVSSATISKWQEIEIDTESPNKRFKTFGNIKNSKIIAVLYIKPVLENITVHDLRLYSDVILKYKISDVVVGSIFSNDNNGKTVAFDNNDVLFYRKTSDEKLIIKELENICTVFTRSTSVVKKYKIE